MLAALAATLICAGVSLPPSSPPEQLRPAIRCLVNTTRAAHGLGPVHGARRLRRAVTQRHLNDMIRHRYFAHGDYGERLFEAGLGDRPAGEVMVTGCGDFATPAGAFMGLMGSPEHRAVLLDRELTRMAVAVAPWSLMPTCVGPGTWVLDLIGPG